MLRKLRSFSNRWEEQISKSPRDSDSKESKEREMDFYFLFLLKGKMDITISKRGIYPEGDLICHPYAIQLVRPSDTCLSMVVDSGEERSHHVQVVMQKTGFISLS